jgi:hypothetical protein
VIIREEAPAWLVGAAGLTISLAIAFKMLVNYGMDPTVFVESATTTPREVIDFTRVFATVFTAIPFLFAISNRNGVRHDRTHPGAVVARPPGRYRGGPSNSRRDTRSMLIAGEKA